MSNAMSEAAATPAPAEKKKLPIVPILVGIAVIAGLVLLAKVLPITDWLKAFQAYVQGLGFAGYVLYAVVYAICCVLFVPASVLTLGAGAIYGIWVGTAVVVCGATLGATLSFLLARTVLRKKVEGMTSGNAKFRALDKAIGKEGAKIVFLVRLAPVFPFTYINYAFGLTGVKTLPYIVASLVGMLPGTLAYVYIGSAAANVGAADMTKKIVLGVGILIAIGVTIFVARIASKAIKNAGVDEAPEAPEPER